MFETMRILDVSLRGDPPQSGEVAIAASYGHAIAAVNGAIYTWGWNKFGQLGMGPLQTKTVQ